MEDPFDKYRQELWERNWMRAAGGVRQSLSPEGNGEPMIPFEGHAWSCLNGWPEFLMRMKSDVIGWRGWGGRGMKPGLPGAQALRRESGLMLTQLL